MKIVMVACFTVAALLVAAAAFLAQQQRVAQGAAEAASFTPAPLATPSVAPLLSSVIPEGAEALMIGDSYTMGTGANDRESGNWAARAASELGWNATILGIGGTGFTWGGGEDGSRNEQFIHRITAQKEAGATPDVVVLQGGQNDHRATPDELRAAVTETVDAAQIAWPDAHVIVVGPTAPQPLGDKLVRMANPIDDAARKAGAASINPIEGNWLTAANSPGFDLDGSHVNDAGHQYLAEKFIAAFRELRV